MTSQEKNTPLQHNLSEHISIENTQMAEVLIKIVNDKKSWLQARKQTQPLHEFIDQLTSSDRDFYHALNTGNTAFILECKKASPSKGLIRQSFDLDYIASVYRQHANAISVLTDEKYFQGNHDFLPIIRDQVTQPILCKDFIIDTYQVYLARYYQADAILLMLSILNDEQYRQLSQLAHTLNMNVLTEISNESELHRAIELQANIIGINNRNLRDLSTDLNRTKQLAPIIKQQIDANKIKQDTILISESGIYTHQQVKELSRYVSGFLIGSALMGEDNLEMATRKVILGENKVCGLTSQQDAQLAYNAGAVYGGFIFVDASPRCINIKAAQEITKTVKLNYVGVFQNHPIETIIDTVKQLNLAVIQLHGDEDETYLQALKTALQQNLITACQIWKVIAVPYQEDAITFPTTVADKLLVDCKVGNQSGGTGKVFNWNSLPHHNIMLAGGLNPDNTYLASQLGCYGLDFNSGVEAHLGKKDPHKIHAVFTALRDY